MQKSPRLPRVPGFFFERPAFDKLTPDMIAETWRIGNANGSLWRNFDFGLDHVFDPITLAGGDIAGKRIAGKGRGGDVVGAADATFEHAAAPGRNIFVQAIRLDGAGARMAADAAEFDIDDAGGAEFNGRFGVAQVTNGFVEAQRGL